MLHDSTVSDQTITGLTFADLPQTEENYGSDLVNLVVAKGYLTKLLANGAVKSHIGCHEPGILTHLELVVNTVSME